MQELTSTFKLRKVDMVKEGFDPAGISDPLFFRSEPAKSYVPLDAALHARILSNQLRV